ncbi:MAG: hypothetical protein QNK37_26830 [Acidobacteriota bacterium]|nr:hypothetical protein [Acidobacteriota bacterium]
MELIDLHQQRRKMSGAFANHRGVPCRTFSVLPHAAHPGRFGFFNATVKIGGSNLRQHADGQLSSPPLHEMGKTLVELARHNSEEMFLQ